MDKSENFKDPGNFSIPRQRQIDIEASPLSLLVIDRIGIVHLCNGKARDTLGYKGKPERLTRFNDLWDKKLANVPKRILKRLNDDPSTPYSSHLVFKSCEGCPLPCIVDIHSIRLEEPGDHFLVSFQLASEANKGQPQKPDILHPPTPVSKPVATSPRKTEKIKEVISPPKAKGQEEEVNDMDEPEREESIVIMGAFPCGEEIFPKPPDSDKGPGKPAEYGFPPVDLDYPVLDCEGLLANMLPLRASDIHLKTGFPPLFRMGNLKLHAASNMDPLGKNDISRLLMEMMDRETYEKIINGIETDFVFATSNGARFRMNAFLSMGTPSLSIRRINNLIPDIETLGLPPVMKKMAYSKSGLLLVTGPTGSGKSTTLAAIVEEINQNLNVHVITLEDPVEFSFSSKKALITQRQIGKDTESFEKALSKVLRQDPDVIMIGEMRDLETISLAVTAAETGHLVLATLHTRDAPGSIDRIVDVFPAEKQDQIKAELSNTLLGVCSQQLLPRVGGGRILVTEMLVGTTGVRNRVRVGGTQQLRNTMLTSPEEGMHTFEQSMARLVNSREITLDVALEHAGDPKELKRFLSS